MRILIALLLLAGCSAPPQAPTGELIEIPSIGIKLTAPPPYAVYSGRPGTMVIDLNPGGRTARTISLTLASSSADSGCAEATTEEAALGGGVAVYRLEKSSGGSGGAESTLTGCWKHGARLYLLQCHHQDEWQPDASFCLPLLATAEVTEVATQPPTVGPGGVAGHPLDDRGELPKNLRVPEGQQ